MHGYKHGYILPPILLDVAYSKKFSIATKRIHNIYSKTLIKNSANI